MSHHPPIQIVDEHDVPVRGATLQEAHQQNLIHRVIHVIVEDADGNILLQKRSPDIMIFPNCWDISVGGHVDLGENYLQAATRELQEELGLKGYELIKLSSYYYEPRINNKLLKRFVTAFKIRIDHETPITFAPSEISEVKWMSVAEIKELMSLHPDSVADGVVECIQRYY